MPEAAGTPKRRVSQAPLKFKDCLGGCGAQVGYRTNPRVYCDACRRSIRLASARASMERQRRKRGIAQIKGTTIPCESCARAVERNRNTRARFCPACRPKRALQRARHASKAKRSTSEGRAQYNTWWQERKRSDPLFHLAMKVRARINAAIRRCLKGTRKSTKTINLLGCSFAAFKVHIERQFTRGMSWEKVISGEVHLDHRRPISSFDLSDPAQQREAFHYLNVQPMWRAENFEKHAKRTLLL